MCILYEMTKDNMKKRSEEDIKKSNDEALERDGVHHLLKLYQEVTLLIEFENREKELLREWKNVQEIWVILLEEFWPQKMFIVILHRIQEKEGVVFESDEDIKNYIETKIL